MNSRLIKLPFLVLAAISFAGVTYFSVSMWTGVGINLLVLLATVVPFLLAWGGIILLSLEQTLKGCVIKFILTSGLAWAWLYIGSIAVGLMRLQ